MNEPDTNTGGQPRRRGFRVMDGGPELARVLPHSIEAEEAFLSTCFVDQSSAVVSRAKTLGLLPRHFYKAAHGIVWEKICAAHARCGVVSVGVVAEELKLSGQLDQVGGYPFLTEISSKIPTTIEALRHLDLVLDYALVRQGIRESNAAAEAAAGWKGEELDGLFGKFALNFQRLADYAMRRKLPSQREIAESARASATAEAAGLVDRTRAIPLGGFPHATASFLAFDVREEDWFNILAGIPSSGKSTLARQHVGHNLLNGKRFAVFLLETSAKRWLKALAGMFAGVNIRDLESTAHLHPDQIKNFDAWQGEITEWMEKRLWIFDQMFFLEDIESRIRELNRTLREKDIAAGVPEDKARGLDGVLGDHLHLLATRKDFRGNREGQVSHIGRTLKMLHKGLDLHGMWLAQLNRKSRTELRRPMVSDLRDSGTLEQDADTVLLIHTPPENKAGQKQDGNMSVLETELIQGKRRNGPAGIAVDLFCHVKFGSYEEATRGATARPGMPKPKTGYKREGTS